MRSLICLCLVPIIIGCSSRNNSASDASTQDVFVEDTNIDSGLVDVNLPDTFVHDTAIADTNHAMDSTVVDSATMVDSGMDSTIDAIADTSIDAMVDSGFSLFDASKLPYQNGIPYNGGPVMIGVPVVYFIWYGTWGTDTAQTILPKMMTDLAAGTSISGNEYLNTVSTYYQQDEDGGLSFLSGKFAFGGSFSVPSTLQYLAQQDMQNIAADFATSQNMSPETISNGIFFVLTSPDIQSQTDFGYFCETYCGWHNVQDYFQNDAAVAKQVYAFVGDPSTQCPASCEQSAHLGMTVSPNGNPGADGMASVIMHELAESLTDPQLNAWTGLFTGEEADLCAWQFGMTYNTSNGSIANINISGNDYLLQEQWSNVNGICIMGTP